ncbi:hypothetical protein FRC12_020170 [Ceratobasidium sp. 428]|nr:hypothetical protein FRC12_020170 [Ceratobasidium sp. 428]
MNVSILFKGVNTKLPRDVLVWDTSTIEILSDIIITLERGANGKLPAGPAKLIISTIDSTKHTPLKSASLSGRRRSYTLEML